MPTSKVPARKPRTTRSITRAQGNPPRARAKGTGRSQTMMYDRAGGMYAPKPGKPIQPDEPRSVPNEQWGSAPKKKVARKVTTRKTV